MVLGGRIWLENEQGLFIGRGKIELLEEIGKEGSILRAARNMGMSYRHAWTIIDEMNRLSSEVIVATATGGRGGGGAIITEKGFHLIQMYRSYLEDFTTFLFNEAEKISSRKTDHEAQLTKPDRGKGNICQQGSDNGKGKDRYRRRKCHNLNDNGRCGR